jgi:transmembrane sensor
LDKQQLYELIDKYLAGEATLEEIDLLSRYYNSFQDNHLWNEAELGEPGDLEAKIFAGITKKMGAFDRDETPEAPARVIEISQAKVGKADRNVFTFLRVATAACFIGLVAWGGVVWFNRRAPKEITAAKRIKQATSTGPIAAGARTMLRLADGSTILLDVAGNGEIAREGNTRVSKTGRRLNYEPSKETSQPVYNTVSTAGGGIYEVDLPDGTRAWLNATSSLRFPVAFVEKQRRVEITGEAYFEVAKNRARPFIVSVNGAEVRVLGTHFNIMAYNDEATVKTSLLEGAVEFVKGAAISTLLPGEQSELLKNGKIIVKKGVDLQREIAWKNDQFDFQGEDIKFVTRELARWYGVNFVFTQNINDHFIAKLPRSTSLPKMLKLLELTGKVRFEMDGSRVIVKR